MSIAKGDILYKSWLSIESVVNGDGCTIEIEEWHITNVNKNGIYLRKRCYFTWGKLSKKHGDYGWLKNTDPFYNDILKPEENYKEKGYHKSKSAAYRSSITEVKKTHNQLGRLKTKIEKQIKKCKKEN